MQPAGAVAQTRMRLHLPSGSLCAPSYRGLSTAREGSPAIPPMVDILYYIVMETILIKFEVINFWFKSLFVSHLILKVKYQIILSTAFTVNGQV